MISDEHLKETCKFGQGGDTCAFLTMGSGGFTCGKQDWVEPIIRARLAAGTMSAKGDNCDGWPS